MLVIDDGSQLCLITQSDHARLAHDILSLWRADGLPEVSWRKDLLRAVAEHDNGWWESDSAPMLEVESGWPCDFRSLPSREQQRLWKRGIERLLVQEPNVAYLVTLYARRLHESLLDDSTWRDFFDFLEECRSALEDRLSFLPEDLSAACEYLELADALSLAACCASGEQGTSWRDYEILASRGHITMKPFPFAGRTTLRVRFRFIAKRRYTGALDLGSELAIARWQTLPVSIETSSKP
jgi:hypothetical protein